MRKTITVGRVKGSMIYTGVNPESVQNPLDNDLYFHTQEYKFYCYNNGSWNEVTDLKEHVERALIEELEEKKVLENIEELQQETIDINNRIDQVEQTKADLSYVKTQDEEIKRVKADIDYVDNEILILTDDVADLYSTKANTQYVNEKFNQILGEGATETLDTIAEISKALEEHNDEYDSLLAVVGNKADKNEVPTKLSDLKIDIEVGGVDEEEVMEIVEENGEEVEAIDLLEIQAEYSIGTSSNYDETNDNQIVTTKAVKSIVDAVANVLQVNIDDKADKTSIPTALSQLNNDSNFITNAVSTLKNYYNKTEVNDLINTAKAYVDSKIESSITTALEGDY